MTAAVPEILEVETYRCTAERIVGRRIRSVETPDEWYLKGADARELRARFAGARVLAARRRGKLLLLDIESGVLGLHFGMTGRLALDGHAPEIELEYAPARDEPKWDRFALCFTDGGRLRLQDPRRLGAVVVDPDETLLGPDAFSVTLSQVRSALSGTAAVKAALLDQSRIAGIGNLLADEILWQARIDPARACRDLDDEEVRAVHRAIRRRLPVLARRGGSHLGEVPAAERTPGVRCPRCGATIR